MIALGLLGLLLFVCLLTGIAKGHVEQSTCQRCKHLTALHDPLTGCVVAKDETGVGGCGCQVRSMC